MSSNPERDAWLAAVLANEDATTHDCDEVAKVMTEAVMAPLGLTSRTDWRRIQQATGMERSRVLDAIADLVTAGFIRGARKTGAFVLQLPQPDDTEEGGNE